MYIDISKALSYNCLMNIFIGERGVGKTYSVSKFITNQFIKKQEEFVYIRRYKPELQKALPQFFTPLIDNNEFPNYNLYTQNNKFYCDKKVCGYAFPLATSQDLKSTNFNKVKNIVFDEFLIEEGQKKYYLKNEVFVFLNMIETISRLRDVRIFLLSNATNIVNPYFSYFNLSLPYNNDFKLFNDNTILVWYMKNQKYRDYKKSTRMGKLIKGTDFEDYSINNIFTDNDSTFIQKKSSSSKFKFSFYIHNTLYGVWFDNKNNLIYISYDYDPTSPFIFSTSLANHNDNTTYLSPNKKYKCWKVLLDNFKLGNVRFENLQIKINSINLFKKLLFL